MPEANYDFESVEVRGFARRFSLDLFRVVFLLLSGVLKSLSIIRNFRPDVVVGLGGYVCVPVAAASFLRGVPVLLHEQNATPGLANRLLAKRAKAVAISYSSSKKYFSGAKRVFLTGNPVRKEITRPPGKDYNEFGLDPARKTIFIFGGSRGAQRINQAAIEAYLLFRDCKNLQIIHSTGMMNFEHVTDAVAGLKHQSDQIIYHCYSYLDQIGLAYSVADLVICRAGATTLAEVTTLGKPSVLIPYPYATDDHQRKNAEALRNSGAATLISDEELNGQTLYEEAARIVFDDDLLNEMSAAARNLGRPNAARELADLVIGIAKSKNNPTNV